MDYRKAWMIRKSPKWRIPGWGIIAYLIINDLLIERLGDLIQIPPNEEFSGMVLEHLTAYLDGGKMPPEAIAPAILNMADDALAGREPTLRAGDYIMLQEHMRR